MVAWHHSQADVRAGNGAAIQCRDGYVNDAQRFGTLIKNTSDARRGPKSGGEDEIAGTKRVRDQFDRVVVFQRRAQQGVDQSGHR